MLAVSCICSKCLILEISNLAISMTSLVFWQIWQFSKVCCCFGSYVTLGCWGAAVLHVLLCCVAVGLQTCTVGDCEILVYTYPRLTIGNCLFMHTVKDWPPILSRSIIDPLIGLCCPTISVWSIGLQLVIFINMRVPGLVRVKSQDPSHSSFSRVQAMLHLLWLWNPWAESSLIQLQVCLPEMFPVIPAVSAISPYCSKNSTKTSCSSNLHQRLQGNPYP